MLAVNRLMNSIRTVMPYATWVSFMVQLGYAGYTAYGWYQQYVDQMKLDARNGINRTAEEVLELIVKPRRRRVCGNIQPQQTNNGEENSNANSTPAQQSGSQNRNSIPQDMDEPRLLSSQEILVASRENIYINPIEVDLSQESPKPSTSRQFEDQACENFYPKLDDKLDDEVLSTASTSLESTDSNKGIVNDMYNECFICATSLNNPDKLVATLPFCMHPFHKTCLDGVIKFHQRCPVCDFNIFSPI